MDEIKDMARKTFLTQNELTYIVSAPGSAGMETVLVNLLEPGDEAIICINGVFGTRMADIASRCGAKVIKVEAPWGKPIETQTVKKAIDSSNPKLVAIVHAETSTGVKQPLDEIGKIVNDANALFVVDAVTSYTGTELRVDDWGVDAIYSGTQKCLSCTPGLSPVSFSDAALEAISSRKWPVQSWFLDLNLVMGYWGENTKRSYHHTAPINALYGLHESLVMLQEEGLENAWARHMKHHLALRAGLEAMGISFVVDENDRLPQLNSVYIPEGVDDAATRSQLLQQYGLEIGAGLGDMAGKIWRIGIMGHTARAEYVDRFLEALESVL